MSIIDYIPTGKENQITCSEIAKRAGIDPRMVRAVINAFRAQGEPIASDSRGYWIAETRDELNKTKRILMHQRNTLEVTISGLTKAQEKMAI